MLRWFEHRQVYIPSTQMEASGADLGRPFEDVYFETSDSVRLNGWFFPADQNAPRSHLVILLLHGNAGNICHRLDYCRTWLELGVNVFVFDYRGYGLSHGRPHEEGTYLDAQAAYTWLRQKPFAPSNIIALGKSLGGGVASELAIRETLGGLILQNTFMSIADLGAELFPWLPVRWVNSIKYNTNSKLPQIRIPVLVAHSRDDEMIGFHHSEKNFAAANEPKMFLEIRGSHAGTLEAGGAHYLAGLEKFFARFFSPRTQALKSMS
jgi:fermentation-respiration switch protein FrsA (DUF1100 family)